MNKYTKPMMETAHIWAKQSYCKRRQVGAVLEKDGRILATGYNGTISKMDNKCEDQYFECPNCSTKKKNIYNLVNLPDNNIRYPMYMEIISECKNCGHSLMTFMATDSGLEERHSEVIITLETNEFTVHAEQNIITFCAKNGIPTNGTTLYVTTSPCKQCAKLIAQSGIKSVVYDEEYKDKSGIDFLKEVGVNTSKYKG